MSRIIVEKEMAQNRQTPTNIYADKSQYNLNFAMPLQNNYPNLNPVPPQMQNPYSNPTVQFQPIHEMQPVNYSNAFPGQNPNLQYPPIPHPMQVANLPDLPQNPNSIKFFHQNDANTVYSFLNSQLTESETDKLFENAEQSLGYSYWDLS